MIDFDFAPKSYFDGTGPSALLAKLSYPESQWGEEISIYAAPLDGKIYFEVVDFYGNEFAVKPERSNHPLSLQEFIVLIETLEVMDQGSKGDMNMTLSGIPEAKSNVYPQLESYFMEKRKNFGML
ncbi:UDP-glucuronosyltransferase [Echinicola soli]|uniref:UDP-glucuronosyltransferase n=1 Tax=Echinicola soli TaxID=2591634 RepID=A0A514CF81_9BACT|nr:UDP-glucuronosyltransferase [Echinicola soli]QDH78483.1 UDP-glucuronosyltransferase [Echinicola soli]